MRGRSLKRAAPRMAGLAWLASSVCSAAAVPAQAPAAASADAAAARRLLATARMWSDKHRADLARDAIRKALLVAPGDPALLAEQVRILLGAGDAQGAGVALARLKALAPDAPATRRVDDEYRVATSGREDMAQIRLLARSGHADEAARRIVVLFPNGAPAGALGAEYYQIVAAAPGGRATSLAALRRAVADDPADTAAAFALARLLNERGDTRAEASRLAEALARRPDVDHAEAMSVWRHVLHGADADPAYADAMRAYLDLAPDDSEFRDTLAALDRQRDAQRRLAHDPGYLAQQRGLQALARGDLAVAGPALEQAAHMRATDADAVGGLGLLRLREGRHDDARALFARAAALAPEQREKWHGLARTAQFWGTLARGRAAAAAGRPQDAEQAARAALALQPDSPDAKLMLVDARLAQHDWAGAEPLLRALLAAPAPSTSAVRSATVLYANTGRADRIEPLLDALRRRAAGADDRRVLDGLRADWLARQALTLADQGLRGPAAQRYEAALSAAPDAPWTRFALARLYRDMGLPQLGRAVMDDGLAQSGTPDMHYATALYRNSIDDVAGAQAALATVAEAQRSDGMRALARRLDVRQSLADAHDAFAQGDRAAAEAALKRAQASSADDPDLLASVGATWIDVGDTERGLAPLRDWIAAHPAQAGADVRLRYGDLLGSARRDDELAAWLDAIRRDAAPDAAQTARLDDQSLRLVLRETDDALARDDFALARRRLDRASPAGRADKRYAFEVADLERAQGHDAAAQAALAPVLARTPDDPDARLALARILEDSGDRDGALAEVRAVLAHAPSDDIDTQLSAARRLSALRHADDAVRLTDALHVAYPARADVTLATGRAAQAQGRYDDAATLYRQSLGQEPAQSVSAGRDGRTPAQSALAGLAQRRDPELETGWLPEYKSGDAGASQYRAQQVPVYVQVPYRYDGHLFLHLDAVHLDAGTLDTRDPTAYALNTFATYAALASPGAPAGSLHQSATGVGVGAGYASDAWRVDLGTSPLGFPVHYGVGGVRYRFDAGPASFTAKASRRSETSSELSYAGLRDPWTGAVWGGVRRDGVDLRASVDVGETNLFAELGAGVLTGRNVERNAEATLRTGFMTPVYRGAGMRISTGLVGNAWHYARNLRFYTYGQGGYYSPQRYLSVGVPIEWSGSRDALAWDLTVTAGVSNSRETDSPYFPVGLPAVSGLKSAQALAGLVYGGSSTRGVAFSYGVAGTVEYRVDPHLSIGARFSIDRSHDYAPSSALLYVRYEFDARERRGGFTPTPVRLYSSE